MACNFPKIYNGCLCPCGKCAGCIRSYRQVWITRAILESYCHDERTNYFVTLTYNDEWAPADGSLRKRDFQLFIKRLRKKCGRCRYFAVGEYGKKSFRPHYHAIIYGFTGSSEDIQACWGQGFTFIGNVTPASCAYVAKYISKRYDKDWRERVESRGVTPEFSLVSRKPGLGHDFVEEISNGLLKSNIRSVPTVLRINGRFMVLGRYLRQKIGDLIGITEEQKQARVEELRKELHTVLCDFYGVAPHTILDYFHLPARDKAMRYLKSLERHDREYVVRQRDNSFMGKL
ncbi:replication initiator protein [Dipodfec virus RodF1_85]|uniref:Replication initiator protein n=1 Tax=Dipodfec virus RodF1_85 TaxID=2929314 RepID=A0A976R8C8_9VIRU|nr:replication initiator protein [Dipodfec virus RodF1_85]